MKDSKLVNFDHFGSTSVEHYFYLNSIFPIANHKDTVVP